MKIKDFFRRLFDIFAIIAALFFAKTFYRAKQFKTSCDINPDTMDTEAIFCNKVVDYGKREMTDFKAGAFLGSLTLDLRQLEFNEKEYDITISIDQGDVILLLPTDLDCIVTSLQPSYLVKDERTIRNVKDNGLIVINASIHFGFLILRN